MIEFSVNGRANLIPENFSEFSALHWAVFVKSLSDPNTQSWDDVKLSFLRKFSNIPFRKLKRFQKKIKSGEDYEEYINHCSKIALFNEKLDFFSKKMVFHINPISYIKYGRFNIFKLFPPDNSLSNMSVWEMAYATKYSQEHDSFLKLSADKYSSDIPDSLSNALNNLIAVLYRRPRFFWRLRYKYGFHPDDRRRRFFDSLVPLFAKKISALPEFKKQLIFFWFNSRYEIFSKNFPEIFSSSKKEDKSKSSDFSWSDIIVSFENSIPGDESKIANSSAYAFLKRLCINKKNIDELNEKYSSKKS
jgi:hypothetical protein